MLFCTTVNTNQEASTVGSSGRPALSPPGHAANGADKVDIRLIAPSTALKGENRNESDKYVSIDVRVLSQQAVQPSTSS